MYFKMAGILIGAFCLAGLLSCGPESQAERSIYEFSGKTMGTTYLVKISSEELDSRQRAALAGEIRDLLENVNQKMSTYLPDSEISRLNQVASGERVSLSPETRFVLRASERIHRESEGAFDITVGPLVELWGFGVRTRSPGKPSEEERLSAQNVVGMEGIQVEDDPPSAMKSISRLQVDLSAIAKGFSVDQVSEHLTSRGFQNHLVEVGGEVRARGEKADGLPWSIGIEHPEAAGRVAFQSITLRNQSVATSGDYRNYYEREGKRYSHTIDPRTGAPVAHSLASATVIHESAMYADGYATAIMVLGPEEGIRFAEDLSISVFLLIRQPDGQFSSRVSSGFEKMFMAQGGSSSSGSQ